MSRNLSSMISEVNSLSGLSSNFTTSRSIASGADPSHSAVPNSNSIQEDSVSQIVSILNAHLGSLKWIDESTNALKERVERFRRGTESYGRSNGGYDNEAARSKSRGNTPGAGGWKEGTGSMRSSVGPGVGSKRRGYGL